MPTFEFYGYSEAETNGLQQKIKTALAHLDYASDIVFVLNAQPESRVETWDGRIQPFVRISSRSEVKLDEMRSLLQTFTDVETVLIGFYPKITAE